MCRLIARLDIKGKNLIKPIQLDGVMPVGCPIDRAKKYYLDGCDEMILMDSVASLYGRNHLKEIIENIAKEIFVPLTVAGGLRTLDNVIDVMNSGADKVAINTQAVREPKFISEISHYVGSQSLVIQIDAKKKSETKWEVFTENGKEATGIDVHYWIEKTINLGAGEILLTSIDKEGTRTGFDLDLYNSISPIAKIPLIASGGMGTFEHLNKLLENKKIDAVAIADILHVQNISIKTIKNKCNIN